MAVSTPIRELFKKLAARYYNLGVKSREQIGIYVQEGILLPQDYKDITGFDYVAPNKEKESNSSNNKEESTDSEKEKVVDNSSSNLKSKKESSEIEDKK